MLLLQIGLIFYGGGGAKKKSFEKKNSQTSQIKILFLDDPYMKRYCMCIFNNGNQGNFDKDSDGNHYYFTIFF